MHERVGEDLIPLDSWAWYWRSLKRKVPKRKTKNQLILSDLLLELKKEGNPVKRVKGQLQDSPLGYRTITVSGIQYGKVNRNNDLIAELAKNLRDTQYRMIWDIAHASVRRDVRS